MLPYEPIETPEIVSHVRKQILQAPLPGSFVASARSLSSRLRSGGRAGREISSKAIGKWMAALVNSPNFVNDCVMEVKTSHHPATEKLSEPVPVRCR